MLFESQRWLGDAIENGSAKPGWLVDLMAYWHCDLVTFCE